MSNWLKYSPISGHGNGIIAITASTLSELEDRVATIVVSNSQYSLSASTSVTQKGAQLTAITFENLTWVTDVPATGGTATKDNCSYTVIGQYTNGTTGDVTEHVTVSGSLNVSVSTEMTRQNVGNLTLTANYDGFSASSSVSVYQAAPSITGIGFTSLVWVNDVPASGGTATKDNCTYTVYAYYDTNMSTDITDVAVITGSLVVPATTATTRENVGTLVLTASYDAFSATSSVTAYQIIYGADEYLTFEIISGGTIYFRRNNDNTPRMTISYSKDDGETWTDYESTPSEIGGGISVQSGDVVLFKGDNARYCSNVAPDRYCSFSGTTARFNIKGNIMSLINSSEFETISTLSSENTFYHIFESCTGLTSAEHLILPAITLTGGCYAHMFEGCTALTSAPILYATTLADGCYSNMFEGCTSLTTAPELPATTLRGNCYYHMFYGCTSLTTAPELPANTLANDCYGWMFNGCTSLTTAPELPATTLTYCCYEYMFWDCTGLTTAPSILPATTLGEYCCYRMFYNCKSLTTAPELPATTLAVNCYCEMFRGCSKLNYIKCLAIHDSALRYTDDWVSGVASSGTFVKAPNMNDWTTGVSGIPTDWIVVNYGLTGISISDLTWVIDIPSSGGTADKNNCSYSVYANYNNGTVIDITNQATVSGSLNVSASTVETRHSAGTLTLTASYSGFTDSNSIDVYQEANITDYSKEYLTLKIERDGVINWKTGSNSNKKTISYSKDNGVTWTNITSSTGGTKIFVSNGDKIKFKGDNESYNGNWLREDYYLPFTVEGNIMSLIDSEGFATAKTLTSANAFSSFFSSSDCTSAENLVLPATTLTDNCYQNMFRSCTLLTTPPSVLPATTLATNCYDSMFYGCESLTTAPELPATTLADSCYVNMFRNCTKLTTPPSVLPATTLATNCYEFMFDNCTSLTIAPELSATTLANNCCHYMFRGCTSLTTAPSVLPATTLVNSCYLQMFYGCTSLTTAPELPATTLAERCYNGMFDGCTSLNYIKCLATDISATYCTSYWVEDVASTGTFVKAASMTSWTTGYSGIPSGWTVTNAS